MKDIFINRSVSLIKTYYPSFDNIKLKEIRYGIEAFYMTFTKLIAIIIISLIIKSFKETMLLLIFFNVLRLTAFGLHASKSYICWISSILVFILLPIIAKSFEIPPFINIVVAFLSLLSYILYAPADTKKRPLVNKKKRIIYKVLTIITGLIYIIFLIFSENYVIKNSITFAMLVQTILIIPATYKFFRLPYRNYLNYENN